MIKGTIKNPDGSTDTLGLTSFTFFSNTSTSPPACETDPNGESYPAYVCLKGFTGLIPFFLNNWRREQLVKKFMC